MLSAYHILQGLFQRCIAISGSSGAWWAHTLLARTSAQDLARFSRCPTDNSTALVDCLRDEDAQTLHIAGLLTPVVLGGYMPLWVPVTDGGPLVPDAPRNNMAEGLGRDFDLLQGNTHHEGASFVLANPYGRPDTGFNLATFKVQTLIILNPSSLLKIIQKIFLVTGAFLSLIIHLRPRAQDVYSLSFCDDF